MRRSSATSLPGRGGHGGTARAAARPGRPLTADPAAGPAGAREGGRQRPGHASFRASLMVSSSSRAAASSRMTASANWNTQYRLAG
jgi:hypothetical protein